MRKASVFCLLALCCLPLVSEQWIGPSLVGNLAWQTGKTDIATPKIGGGLGVGTVYQIQYKRFTFELGLEFAFNHNIYRIKDSILRYDMIDIKGEPFIFNGYTKNRKDMSNNLSVNFPLMFGIEYNYFYGGVGAKVNFNLHSGTKQTYALSTTGDYDRFYEELANRPDLGFYDFLKNESKGTIKYNFDVRLVAEVGVVLHTSRNTVKYRAGFFVEYGLLNILKNNSGLALYDPSSLLFEQQRLETHHFHLTTDAAKAVHNLLVGVRLAILFPIATSYRYPCRCVRSFAPSPYRSHKNKTYQHR